MSKLFLVILFLFPMFLLAQRFPGYISIEGGGNGINGSVNFGKPIIIHPSYRVNFQWGVGWSSKSAKSKVPINFPVQLVSQFGKENFFFEAGVGSSLIFESTLDKSETEKATNEFYLSPIIGFRQETRKWFWRLYACPLFHVSGKETKDDLTSGFVKFGIGFGIIL